MGQQQRLLVTLGAIIVGATLLIGFRLFSSYDAQANEDALRTDILYIASRAQDWYRKPRSFGGGGRTFAGLKLDDLNFPNTNENGAFSVPPAKTSKNQFEIVATGKGDRDGDGDVLKLTAVVGVDSVKSITITER